ncbi:hypothetical protein QQG91_11455 [Marivivens sp. LCG002]|uniref:hypothetical protein n=1 Tax=Marivivens sp. LCG002 TaxID=3051171 RepID=UPI002553522D|nr:hypothetical protein [Marivivens sp. LCG002]WIV50280.1 hypothetical protein QQG91_11455 [Marivivens sp. LCG002]
MSASLKIFFRFFRVARTAILGVLLVVSLSLNIGLFISDGLMMAASKFVSAFSGKRSLVMSQADELIEQKATIRQVRGELAETSANLANERAAHREARDRLVHTTQDLTTERTITRQLRDELDQADRMIRIAQRSAFETGIDTVDGSRTIREAMRENTMRLASRTENMGKRNIAGMAGEAIPYFGATVIVGVTALDIHDLCEMAQDSNELYYSIFPDERPDEIDPTVCGMKVPTKTEIWEWAKTAPGEAYMQARGAMPSLEEIGAIESADLWAFGVMAIDKSAALAERGSDAAKMSWRTLSDLWSDWNR